MATEENVLIEEVSSVGNLRIQIWHEDFQHALEGHPEVTLERVRAVLADPARVVESRHSRNACLFYSFELVDELTGEKTYFCVEVAVIGDGKGKMETAYETTYMKNGRVIFEKGKSK
jgi:hypothetical protein